MPLVYLNRKFPFRQCLFSLGLLNGSQIILLELVERSQILRFDSGKYHLSHGLLLVLPKIPGHRYATAMLKRAAMLHARPSGARGYSGSSKLWNCPETHL